MVRRHFEDLESHQRVYKLLKQKKPEIKLIYFWLFKLKIHEKLYKLAFIAACAEANRAIGTLYGEQLT